MNTKEQSAKLTFDQFAELASTQANKHYRRGQAMMNVLNEFSNEIYSAITDFGASKSSCWFIELLYCLFGRCQLETHFALFTSRVLRRVSRAAFCCLLAVAKDTPRNPQRVTSNKLLVAAFIIWTEVN